MTNKIARFDADKFHKGPEISTPPHIGIHNESEASGPDSRQVFFFFVRAPAALGTASDPAKDYDVRAQISLTSIVIQGQGILSLRAAENVCVKTLCFGLDPTKYLRTASVSTKEFEERLKHIEKMHTDRFGASDDSLRTSTGEARNWMCDQEMGLRKEGITFDTEKYFVSILKLVHCLIGLRGGVFVETQLREFDWASCFTSMPWFGPPPLQLVKAVLARIWQLTDGLEATINLWYESSFGFEPCIPALDEKTIERLIEDVDNLVYTHALLVNPQANTLPRAEALSQYRTSLNSADGEAPPDSLLYKWCRSSECSIDVVSGLVCDMMCRRVDGRLVDVMTDAVAALVDAALVVHLSAVCHACTDGDGTQEGADDMFSSLFLCMEELARALLRARVRRRRCQDRRRLWPPAMPTHDSGQPPPPLPRTARVPGPARRCCSSARSVSTRLDTSKVLSLVCATRLSHLPGALKQQPPTGGLFTAAGWTRIGQKGRGLGYDWSCASTKACDADTNTVQTVTELLVLSVRFLEQAPGVKDKAAEAVTQVRALLSECNRRDERDEEAPLVMAATVLAGVGAAGQRCCRSNAVL